MSDPGSLPGFCLFSILTGVGSEGAEQTWSFTLAGGADYEGMSKYQTEQQGEVWPRLPGIWTGNPLD